MEKKNESIAIKYTDDVYATRREVEIALNTSLIDPIWNQIIDYRSHFIKYLAIFDPTKSPYYIVFTKAVSEKILSLENKLSEVALGAARLGNNAPERVTIRQELLVRILQTVAQYYKLQPSTVTIANIVNERPVAEEYNSLVNYYNCIKLVQDNCYARVSEDLLADYYATIQGVSELTSFYRTNEIYARDQIAMVGRTYTSAPVKWIEPLMNKAFYFFADANYSYIVKAFIGYFTLNQIKPFSSYNEALSILITKNLLANKSIEKLAAIIPLEDMLLDNDKKLAKGMSEAIRTNDLTYLFIAFMDNLERLITVFNAKVEKIQLTKVSQEFLQGDDPVEFKKEAPDYYKEKNQSVPDFEPIVELTSEPKKQPVVETPAPEVKKETKKVEKQYIAPAVRTVTPSNNAHIDYDALAEDLLESDPFLRPAQAAFYVRHCTVGKYYTISQYQKAAGCVYETARTSMDNLAKRGYYKRENLKNKFIYTPIAKE